MFGFCWLEYEFKEVNFMGNLMIYNKFGLGNGRGDVVSCKIFVECFRFFINMSYR